MTAKLDGNASVVRIADAWYVLCESRQLRDRPLARTLLGQPLVLFRGVDGRPGALQDRCPHRNMPLSAGRVVGDRIECAYHGWQFDARGQCGRIPGLTGDPNLPSRAVSSHAAREQHGYVWVFGDPDVEPATQPFSLPVLDKGGYTTVRRVVEAEATVHATVENALDVPHTAFVHRGLFRGTGTTATVKAVVTRNGSGIQTEYIGEPRPQGVAARILAPSGGVVTHYDRFFLPSIAQVEYAIGDQVHIVITAICTPVEAFLTRLYATVSFRTRLPGWLVKAILNPVATKIFNQDAKILKTQAHAIRRFGGERYTSTEIDLMGPQILRLMRIAERGKSASESDDNWRREVQFEV